MPFNNAQENGKPVAIKDEGITLTPSVGSIDFAGAGVTGGIIGADVTETIPGGAGAVWITEDVTGTIDGSNPTFTLTHTPVAGSLSLRLGRQPQELTTDFTISGPTITYNSDKIPTIDLAGQPHKATYQY